MPVACPSEIRIDRLSPQIHEVRVRLIAMNCNQAELDDALIAR